MQSLSKTPSIHYHLPSCKTIFLRHIAYLHASTWCGTSCHLSFTHFSNCLEIRVNSRLSQNLTKSDMVARFRETIPTVKSVSSSETYKNSGFLLNFYRSTILSKIRIFRGFTPCLTEAPLPVLRATLDLCLLPLVQ